jgi:hypothetical protein
MRTADLVGWRTTCGRVSDLIIRSTGVTGHLGLGGRLPPNGEFDDMFSHLGRGDSDMRDERVGAGQIGLGLLWQSPPFCGESCL